MIQGGMSPLRAIPLCVKSYNMEPNIALPDGLSPGEVNANNIADVIAKRLDAHVDATTPRILERGARFSVGQTVLKQIPLSSKFHKASDPTYDREHYVITQVIPSPPNTFSYRLKGATTNIQLPGTYQEDQLDG